LGGLSFGYDIKSVNGGGWGDLLFCSVRPTDFDGVDFGYSSEAEVRALVGTGGEAAACKNVGTLSKAVGGEVHHGSDCVARRLGTANEFESDPVVW
jgi:hypothetical protein